MRHKRIKIANNTTQFINQAWIRNGDSVVAGEALILATLLHSTGKDRAGSDFKVVQELMDDVNFDSKEK